MTKRRTGQASCQQALFCNRYRLSANIPEQMHSNPCCYACTERLLCLFCQAVLPYA